MTYNLLDYPFSNGSARDASFRKIINFTQPDILVVQELSDQQGMFSFLNQVMKPVNLNYSAGTFIDGPTTDNAIYFDQSKFNFISHTAIPTSLRDISKFEVSHKTTGDTLILFVCHLKASSGINNENIREAQVNTLRTVTDNLPSGTEFLILGDFNIYGSFENAYQNLLIQNGNGYVVDLYSLQGTWNSSAFAPYHTQSTRINTSAGAGGGLDDRFDMILFSQGVIDTGGISYISNSYIPVGNDGNHYNGALNQLPNLSVPDSIANALYIASDHLPLTASLLFGAPLQIVNSNIVNASCSGISNGSISITVNGGTPPYSFNWSEGSTTQNIFSLAAGVYTLTLTDAANNSMLESFTVNEQVQLSATISKQNVLCNGVDNGAAQVVGSGGTGPYLYFWSTNPGVSSAIVDGLPPGNYSVDIVDQFNCIITKTVAIFEPPVLQLFYIPTFPSPGQNDGGINLLVTGGRAPYLYQWSNGAVVEDLTNIGAGVYYVTVIDRNGCAQIAMVNLQ